MRFLKSKKVWWLPASAAVLALLAVAAYAHFSRAGSGTGKLKSGQIGSIKISSDPAGPLYPVADLSGGSKVTVRVYNNGAGKQYVGQITGTVADNTGCSGPPTSGSRRSRRRGSCPRVSTTSPRPWR